MSSRSRRAQHPGSLAGSCVPTAPIAPFTHSTEELLRSGTAHHLAGRSEEAAAHYRAILERNPAHGEALCLMGILAQQNGNFEMAIERMRQALSTAPNNPSYLHTLADALRDARQFEQAAPLYEQLLEWLPDNKSARFKYAGVLQQLRHYLPAVAQYQRVLAADPQFVEAHNDLGAAHIALRQWDAAAESIDQALLLKPDYADAHNNRGVIYKNQKQFDAAIHSYQEALRCQPRFAMALFNLGTVHFTRKEYALAKPLYEQSLALDPSATEPHQTLAFMAMEDGQLEQAQAHWDAAYQNQHFFFEEAQNPRKTILVLWSAGTGNVPVEHLWPNHTFTRICAVMEYVTDTEMQHLPHCDVVFNAIGDRDSMDGNEAAVRRFLAHNHRPFLNHPDAVFRTARDTMPALFASIPDVVCPPTLRQSTDRFKDAVGQCAALEFPLIVRPGGSHGGSHLVKLDHPDQLQALALFNARVYYATRYVDYRSADGYFRKYRMIFVARKCYPYHLAIGKHWVVHYETADMNAIEWKLREERAFLENPRAALGDRAMDAVQAIGQAMDLDYCGIDFSLLPDGQVLVFEANATMLVHGEAADSPLAHKNPFVAQIFDALHQHVDALTKPL